ncbi:MULTISPECIES: DUF6680 family protein [unclassified Sphingomonas]|uniref:DUF6680 family protein n=1 Tax=unclassified Sphingomonas TaxID=196159 RepID=UPI000831EF74|nr:MULTISPECIES: DUF6680 family protein [unclassified Sphingomonas]
MTTLEIINLVAILLGPIFAVGITLWIEDRRKTRDAKITVLRMLLATRQLPSDPGFQVAIQLVPVEFNKDRAVLIAHAEFLVAANVPLDGKNDEQIGRNTRTKLVRMIFEMARASGLNLRETDIDTSTFGSRGFYERDAILVDSQRAMREIAEVLKIQTRVMLGEQVVPEQPAITSKEIDVSK